MKILVTGGREFADERAVDRIFREISGKHTLIHGAGRGADRLAARIAKALGWEVIPFPADWRRGRSAGPERNQKLVDQKPDVVLAFPGGDGTADCVRRARKAGIQVVFPCLPPR